MQDHFASLQDGHNNKKQSDKLAQQVSSHSQGHISTYHIIITYHITSHHITTQAITPCVMRMARITQHAGYAGYARRAQHASYHAPHEHEQHILTDDQDLKQEVDAVREQLKSLVTSNDMHQLRFNMEQKQKVFLFLLSILSLPLLVLFADS